MAPQPGDVTQLLLAFSAGDRGALDRLMPLVYDELRAMAARALRGERSDQALNTTALVHEAYMRLVDQRQVDWKERAQFYRVAAQIMRRLLVDDARRRGRAKRGGGQPPSPLDEDQVSARDESVDIVALDESMTKLAEIDAKQASIVELRFFGGLTVEETARILETSPATIKREWTIARAWLRHAMGPEHGGSHTRDRTI